MTMRFRTRAFLICFVPFAVLLAASFWMIQRFVQSTVSDDMRASLRENQLAISRIHAKSNLQNSRFLKVAGENPALKAGMQLLISERSSRAARQTVEDQLHELGEHMGFDLLMVFAPSGEPLAGVIRKGAHADSSGELVPINTRAPKQGDKGLLLIDGRIMQVASVPIDENDENIGYLSVGEYFDFSEFITPAVLIDNGRVIESNVPNISLETLNKALKGCPLQSECELQMGGATWVSLPVQALSDGTGDVIRTLENVDAATGPVQARLRHLFFAVALGSVLIVFLCSVASARTIVKPIATVVAHLRNSTWIGELPEFQSDLSSPILEIRELAESYNWAAISIKKARESLQRAYVEFVGSLANALDARDRYTAGHSWRVSQLSCALAAALELDPDEVERVRVGALLHDIGKIGVSDSVLQKAGRLTDEEFALVKEHPVTGLRILQGVQGFAPFLSAVELHHENWDGTGYPRGLVAKQVPVEARIIHVADAYDAMTTDRSYRPGMKHERAIQILEENAGTQFDPTVVRLLTELPREIVQGQAMPAIDVEKQEVVEVA